MERLLDIAAKWIRPVAIPHLALPIVVAQAVAYLWLGFLPAADAAAAIDRFQMVPARVLAGEWWRPLTFVLQPPSTNPIFALMGWMLFLTFASALEREWGPARFNLFLLIGWVATIGASFAAPERPVPNIFLGASVLLAFAALAPNFTLMIFLVLPVKVKWIALLTWIGMAFTMVTGDGAERIAVAASVVNWFAFVGPRTIGAAAKAGRAVPRRLGAAAAAGRAAAEPFHRCRVCGRTEQSDPRLEFRYCDRCVGAPCYCMDHLRSHEHIGPGQNAGAPSPPGAASATAASGS